MKKPGNYQQKEATISPVLWRNGYMHTIKEAQEPVSHGSKWNHDIPEGAGTGMCRIGICNLLVSCRLTWHPQWGNLSSGELPSSQIRAGVQRKKSFCTEPWAVGKKWCYLLYRQNQSRESCQSLVKYLQVTDWPIVPDIIIKIDNDLIPNQKDLHSSCTCMGVCTGSHIHTQTHTFF